MREGEGKKGKGGMRSWSRQVCSCVMMSPQDLGGGGSEEVMVDSWREGN